MGKLRMVVTGHDENGESRFVRDEIVGTLSLDSQGEWAKLWASNTPATYPDDGRDPSDRGLFPPVGGVRVYYSVSPPNGGYITTYKTLGADDEEGVVSEDSGWHVSDTTDFVFILSGQVLLETDRDSKLLTAGDFVVQNGTRHRWHVVGDTPNCKLGFITGARRA